jgi:hypothetical protein
MGSVSLYIVSAQTSPGTARAEKDQKQNHRTMTGCFSKGLGTNQFLFVEDSSGKRFSVTGSPELLLSKHAAEHAVRLTVETDERSSGAARSGASSAAQAGQVPHTGEIPKTSSDVDVPAEQVKAVRVEHVSDTCRKR